jgi:hypothetical protein
MSIMMTLCILLNKIVLIIIKIAISIIIKIILIMTQIRNLIQKSSCKLKIKKSKTIFKMDKRVQDSKKMNKKKSI